jgi:hypothetical protein
VSAIRSQFDTDLFAPQIGVAFVTAVVVLKYRVATADDRSTGSGQLPALLNRRR